METQQPIIGANNLKGNNVNVTRESWIDNHYPGEKVSTDLKLYDESWNNKKSKLLDEIDKFEFSTPQQQQKRKKPNSCSEEEESMTKLELYKNPWKITKKLKKSDIDGSSRLLLEKASVETDLMPNFDPARSRELKTNGGTRIMIRDLNTGTEHELTFKRWPSTGGFVLIKYWKEEFVMRRNLRQGDEIGLFWDQDSSRLNFGVLGRSLVN